MAQVAAGPGTSGEVGPVPEPLSDLLARRLLAQRVVLLHGPLDDLSTTRVSAELMTLDAEGDEPVTLRVDCGEAALAPALTLMDVIELMGVPVRALCLGQVASGAVGVVAVCAHRAAMPSTRFSLCEPVTQLQAHVRNVAQWAELRAARAGAVLRPGGRRHAAARPPRSRADLERGRFLGAAEAVEYGILDEVCRPDAPVRPPAGSGPAAHGIPAAALSWGGQETGPVLHAYDAAMSETGPRLPPLPAGEWDERLTRVLENSPGGTDEPMHIFATLGRADPELFRRWLGFGGALLSGSLPGRLRELVILRTAIRFGGRYEWAHHLELGEAEGITWAEMAALEDDRRRARRGRVDPAGAGRARAVDETAVDGAVGDATWEALAAPFRESQLIELLMLIAHYDDADERAALTADAARAPGRGTGLAPAGRAGGLGGTARAMA